MNELPPGANQSLPGGVVHVRVPGPFDISALITGDDRQVSGDADFVFFNQLSAPGVRLGGDTVTVDPPRLRAGATRVTVVISPADTTHTLGELPPPAMVLTGDRGTVLARFTPPRPRSETVLLLAEIYRRGAGWKVRALGQGYADGLAGIARDFGVDVEEETQTPSELSDFQRGVVELTNVERARHGLRPLLPQPQLTACAQAFSADMITRAFFSHTDPDGREPWDRAVAAGYLYSRIGENIACGQETPAEVVQGWMDSPGHRKNILTPEFTEIGVGYVTGGPYGTSWTQVFGTPR
jgi:stress response protein SCP2